jgi:hypothetical protein
MNAVLDLDPEFLPSASIWRIVVFREKPLKAQATSRANRSGPALCHVAETGTPVALQIGKEHPKYRGWRPAAATGR